MILVCLLPCLIFAQMAPNVPPPVRPPAAPVIIDEAAQPVIIDGKRADQLSDDELQEFLQEKILNIHHPDGQVQLLRVAPGYPLTLSFQEQFNTVIVGDPGLVKTEKIGRNIILTALEREGDTSIQVLFPGNKLRVYHVLIAPNFLTGLTAVRVASFDSDGSSMQAGLLPDSHEIDVKLVARVIADYDAMLQEKALDTRDIRRLPVFRSNPSTGFTIYYLYRFASGLLAVSFAYQNLYVCPIRYEESRLRLALGNLLYLPDYTSFHRTILQPGETTTGFTVVRNAGFRLDQPFEIVWK